MIPSLEEVDAFVPHQVNDAMLEAVAPRPDVRSEILEGFGPAESRERVAQDVQDDVENAGRVPPIGLYPIPQVLEKRRVEEGDGAVAFAIPAEGRRKRFITWP